MKVNEEENSSNLAVGESHLTGRELDAAVHRDVMNLTARFSEVEIPHYSRDISSAMQVVDHFQRNGVGTLIHVFSHTTQVHVEMNVPSSECQEWGATMAEAICRCALKAQTRFQLFAERVSAIEAGNQGPVEG